MALARLCETIEWIAVRDDEFSRNYVAVRRSGKNKRRESACNNRRPSTDKLRISLYIVAVPYT